MELHTSVVAMIQQRSTVISLFDDYGIDLQEIPPWEFRRYVSGDDATVHSESPLRITVPVRIDDEFTVLVDDGMEVSTIES